MRPGYIASFEALQAIAHHEEALHMLLTASAIAAWWTGAPGLTPAERDLERRIRAVLTDLHHLRQANRSRPVSAERWESMRAELAQVHHTVTWSDTQPVAALSPDPASRQQHASTARAHQELQVNRPRGGRLQQAVRASRKR
jgi:hypothetical protein